MILTNPHAQRIYLGAQQFAAIGASVDVTIAGSPWSRVRIAEESAGGIVTVTRQSIGLPLRESYASIAAMAAAYGIDTTQQ